MTTTRQRRRYRRRARVYIRRPGIRVGCGPVGCWIPLCAFAAGIITGLMHLL